MKKKGLIALLFVFALVFMTGCGGGGNKLTCTLEQEKESGGYVFEINAKISLDYDKDEIITAADAEIEMVVPKDAYNELEKAGVADSTMQQLANQLKVTFQQQGIDGVADTETKINKNVLKVLMNIDTSKKERTKKEAIDYYSEKGFKCK